ncbi:MAG: hypothetical protein ABSC93_10035 [Bryobacteraceae bacterium]
MALALAAISVTLQSAAWAQDERAQFMGFDTARPILKAMSASLPEGLREGDLDAAHWAEWLKKADASVRHRLEAGEEDTLTNLLRFGVTFTREYRIDDEYFARYGESTLVDSFAEHRAHDLIQALAVPGTHRGFLEMRALLQRKGFPLRTAADRAAAQRYLLKNMARMHKEFLQARERAKSDRSQMFQDRGISLDSNLWPDYDLDVQFRQMAAKGMLRPGSLRKVAIVGPGLDFVNKQEGVDFYPPQTLQPFAVLDSLLRQGLADAGAIEIHTMDISSLVNAHILTARTSAAQGRPYTVQLPWFSGGRWSADFRGKFVDYWRGWGSRIGEPVAPIEVPQAAAGIETRGGAHPSGDGGPREAGGYEHRVPGSAVGAGRALRSDRGHQHLPVLRSVRTNAGQKQYGGHAESGRLPVVERQTGGGDGVRPGSGDDYGDSHDWRAGDHRLYLLLPAPAALGGQRLKSAWIDISETLLRSREMLRAGGHRTWSRRVSVYGVGMHHICAGLNNGGRPVLNRAART